MLNWISTLTKYLNKFLELGVVLLAVSVIAEIVFGPNVAFFGSQVTANLIALLNSLGSQGTAAIIIVLAVIFVYAYGIRWTIHSKVINIGYKGI